MIITHHNFHDSSCKYLSNLEYDTFSLGEIHMIIIPYTFHTSPCKYLSKSYSLLLVVYSTRRFVVCLSVCHFVLVFFSPFSIAITSLGEERANLSAFRTFVRFVLVWICRFSLPLRVWEGLRFVIVALPGLFSYLFLSKTSFLLERPV